MLWGFCLVRSWERRSKLPLSIKTLNFYNPVTSTLKPKFCHCKALIFLQLMWLRCDVMWFPMTLPTMTFYDVWYAAVIRLIISNKDSRWRRKKCPQLCQFIQMWQPWSDYDVLRQAYRALKEPFFARVFLFTWLYTCIARSLFMCVTASKVFFCCVRGQVLYWFWKHFVIDPLKFLLSFAIRFPKPIISLGI